MFGHERVRALPLSVWVDPKAPQQVQMHMTPGAKASVALPRA